MDPELLKTFAKLGINIEEQKRLANVAVDIVVDSVSVKTTFRENKDNFLGVFFTIKTPILNMVIKIYFMIFDRKERYNERECICRTRL